VRSGDGSNCYSWSQAPIADLRFTTKLEGAPRT
jgi:hypothetical protein